MSKKPEKLRGNSHPTKSETRRDLLKRAIVGLAIGSSTAFGEASECHRRSVETFPRSRHPLRQPTVRIESVLRREDTVLRLGGNGDNWHMSWASDNCQYVSLCDGAGFEKQPREFYNSRLLAISGMPHDARFHDLPGYPRLSRPTQGNNDTRYYNFGTLAIDGYIYQFLSTINCPTGSREQQSCAGSLRFNGAKLIYSSDNGRSWRNQDGSTPVVWEHWNRRSRDTMVFFEEDQDAFSLLTVLQMGKNYKENVDGYIYVYAPNGNTEGTMNELVMLRVPKGKLLDRANYEYFAGRSSDGRAKWTRDIESRQVVHTFPRGWVNKLVHPYAWHPSVVYNAPLGIYMMVNWGMGTTSGGVWFGKPSYLGFWTAPNPWGPWIQVHEETAWLPENDTKARAYQPQIAPKWISADGKSLWLVWTDYQGADSEPMSQFWKESKLKADTRTVTEADVTRSAMMMRKHMPYYAFNLQRVDLVLG